MVPPFAMGWIRSKWLIEQQFQSGKLPQNAASQVFKVPGKSAGKKLLSEIWIAGNKFRAVPYIRDKADTFAVCVAAGSTQSSGAKEACQPALSSPAPTRRGCIDVRWQQAAELGKSAHTQQ
jgi:hypothetical protein